MEHVGDAIFRDFGLDGQNRQSAPIASVREGGRLSQAILQLHVEQTLHRRTPIARIGFGSQHSEGRVYEHQFLFSWGDVTSKERY